MPNPSLSEAVALRIALAARSLPDMDARVLVRLLLNLVGAPITEVKLAKLRKPKFVAAAEDLLEQASENDIVLAVNYLKGRGINVEPEPLPEVDNYQEGDMPGSIRIACCSNSADNIDGHFGSCARFLIYQVAAEEIRLVAIREIPSTNEEEDKNVIRVNLINDCHVLCTASIGGPATAKVVRAGLHPIKLKTPQTGPQFTQELSSVLRTAPPPWLAKVMGKSPEARARFAFAEEEVS